MGVVTHLSRVAGAVDDDASVSASQKKVKILSPVK
jgi:hypothetical protein